MTGYEAATVALQPCPFCCGAQGPVSETDVGAIAAWNCRAPAVDETELDRLREAAKEMLDAFTSYSPFPRQRVDERAVGARLRKATVALNTTLNRKGIA